MLVYVVTLKDSATAVATSLQEVLEDIESIICDGGINSEYYIKVKIVEMTTEQFNSLPDFAGW